MLTLLHLELPGPFGTLSMLLLDLDQRNHFIAQSLRLPIQYCHRSLNIIQSVIILNIIQGDNHGVINHILLKLRNKKGIVDLVELIRKI